MGEMRGLSLTQPWAQLVAIGAKRIETRSWSTRWRGLLAIHAAKGYPADARAFRASRWATAALDEAGITSHDDLPLGAIVVVAPLVDCRLTGTELVTARWVLDLVGQELAFGDYSPRRFGWFLEDVRRLAEPVPCRGALGLWELPPDVMEGIERQLAARAS